MDRKKTEISTGTTGSSSSVLGGPLGWGGFSWCWVAQRQLTSGWTWSGAPTTPDMSLANPMAMKNCSSSPGVDDAPVGEMDKHYFTVGINMIRFLRSTLCKWTAVEHWSKKMLIISVQTSCSKFPLSSTALQLCALAALLLKVLSSDPSAQVKRSWLFHCQQNITELMCTIHPSNTDECLEQLSQQKHTRTTKTAVSIIIWTLTSFWQ